MGEYSSTILSCTKPELIASGSTFNQNTESELLEAKDGKALYRTWKSSMHNEITELSRLYPEETFTITWWWEKEYNDVIFWTGVFINGKYKEVKSEPRYSFSYKSELIDSELNDKFIQMISQRLEQLNKSEEYSDQQLQTPIINNEWDDDGFKAYLTFHWETEVHRFIGENRNGYKIDVKYENKDKENLERLRSENKKLKKKLNGDPFYGLPF